MDKTSKIWDQFANELKWFISSKINNKLEVEDLLQEIFVKIHANIDSLRDDSKIRAWIYQITRNSIIDYYRTKKPVSENITEISVPFEEEDNLTNELAESIRKMINNLPDKYAEALCLNECNGLSQKEIAQKMSLSYSTVKSRIQRGREMLRDDLMRCCHYEFDKYGKLIDYHPITCCCCSQHTNSGA